jgi:glycosyltransferase involved in cell wall biosynthesis
MNDVIFAGFHEMPPDSSTCRSLLHSKGSLMVPGGFLNKWFVHPSTTFLVTTEEQSQKINKGLQKSAPKTAVFTPMLNTSLFRLPSKIEKQQARNSFQISEDVYHIVYAGRFIANKGIAQVVRAIKLFTSTKIVFTCAGSFEESFEIEHSNANHLTFSSFFKNEILNQNNKKIINKKTFKIY